MVQTNNLFKRILDIIGALVFLVLFFPVYVIVALLVKIDSKGPVIFRQLRLGKNGKEYCIFKFRTMIVNAENMGSGLYNYANDPRVTKLGRFLRNTSIDEIPQVFNILKGDMSFVGPRPPVNYELGDYNTFTGALKDRFRVKPGVTGYSQINGRNELTWPKKIVYDNKYIEDYYKWGIFIDLKVILITIIKVLKNEGAKELEINIKEDSKWVKSKK